MGLFKSKRREDEDFVMNYKPEEDFFENEDVQTPTPSNITKEEILGTEPKKEVPQNDISPLEMLRQQMIVSSAKEKAEEDDEGFVPSFSIDTSAVENLNNKTEDVTDTPSKTTTELPKEEPVQQINNATVNTADIFTPKSQDEEDVSVLQKCMPFILDGEEELKQKPTYTLESVNSILGIEEKNVVENAVEDIAATTVINSEALKAIKNMPDISDIDSFEKINTEQTEQPTIMFDKLAQTRQIPTESLLGEEANIDISSGAPLISKEEYYEEDEEKQDTFFVPNDYNTFKDAKRIKKSLFKERRSSFCTSVISILLLPIISAFRFSALYSENSDILLIISGICAVISILCNFNIFESVKTLFTKRVSAQLCVLASELSCVAYIIYGIISGVSPADIYNVTVIMIFMLTFRNLGAYMKASYLYTNFIQIGNKRKKHVLTLIDDAPTTYSMSRNSIDGEVLAAAPREVENATGFLTNSSIDIDFMGKVTVLLAAFFGVSVLTGIGVGYYHADFSLGFSSFATVMCIFASPLITLCYVMPLKRAASRLNKHGAMLTSYSAATEIEQANAIVFDCETIFPKGTVNLYQMKVLSENDITETLACAASITEYMHSPLSQVFSKIMETNADIEAPAADSIKYEENLGITGWVDKKRVYIGNRSLMAAHEIDIPDISVDRNILKKGYFPIYLACDGKACALLAIRYTPLPSIAKELRKLSELGVTMLINNCDQNITSDMLCDYFDLYKESVTIMSGSGVHMYKKSTTPQTSLPAKAAFGQKITGFAALLSASVKTVKSVKALMFMYFSTSIITFIMYVYMSIGNSAAVLSASTVAAFQAVGYIISYIVYLFSRP